MVINLYYIYIYIYILNCHRCTENEKLLEDIITKKLYLTPSSSSSIMPPVENITEIAAIEGLFKMVRYFYLSY